MSDTAKRTLDLSARRKELLTKLKQQEGITSTVSSPLLKPVPRKEGELFPLSFAQQRLWILDQIDPDTPIYNIPMAWCLRGKINIESLRHALSAVVQRHEALRTAFVEREGVPFQKIISMDGLALPMTDLRSLELHAREQEVLRRVEAEAIQPFDLTQGLLLRAAVLQLAEDEYVLTLTMHHIASDAWSMGVLYQEILAYYQAFEEGRAAPLPELPVQYIDYALWQRAWLQGELLERQLDYWKKQLAGLPDLLQLPTDRPRPAIQTFRGATFSFQLTPALTAELQALSQREGTTLFMTMLAAFQLWLFRHTEQEDIAVGTPIANRPQSDLELLVGFFLNTLVLRTDLSGNPSFRELLKRVKDVTLDAFHYREVPFELVVESLQPERNLSYSPLFQVLFTLENKSASSNEATNFLVTPMESDNTVAKFDLSLAMTQEELDGQSVLSGDFEYNCDLFDPVTVERFAQRFILLLEEIVARPERLLGDLSVLSAAEREQVLTTWNATRTDTLRCAPLQRLFEEQAARTPDALALVVDQHRLSYKQLDCYANQLAHYLRKRGIGPEVIVGLCLPRSAELLVALLGILKAGGAYVPLDPTYPAERLRFQLQDAKARVLITTSEMEAWWDAATTPCLLLDKRSALIAQEPEGPLEAGPVEESGEHLAYVIYTSGSTGRPKGVSITHRNAQALVSWGLHQFSPEELQGVLAGTSICFDLSIFELFVPLSAGGCVYLVEDGLHLPQKEDREQITLINTVPSVMSELVRGGLLPASVQVVNLAGEILSGALVEEIYQLRHVKRVYNLYGPTEDTTYSTWALINRGEQREPTIGHSLDNRQVYVLDKQGEPVPIGVPGEIYLGGAGLTRGYLGQPDLTAQSYRPHPFSEQPGARLYKTGDRARWLADGKLEYLGRQDYQVKIRGFRIEPGEIEQRLARHPSIRESIVVTRRDLVGRGMSLVAYLVPQAETELVIKEIRMFLRQDLPDYMLPAFFEILGALPRTLNGKVDRQALPAPQIGKTETGQHMQSPRNPQEDAVAEIWKQVLGREELGIRENFFEIGGHSLFAMQVISRIRAVFQIELPLRRLFELPTIEGLAEAITLARNEEQPLLEPPITRATSNPAQHAVPISFAQQRLWILDRLDPGSNAYNMPLALHMSGQLDREALERSLRTIVERHAVLRTTFPIVDDTPVQLIVSEPEDLSLPCVDLRNLPMDDRLQTALRMIAEEAQRPFDLRNGPLFRAQLICVDDTNHGFLLTMHHIVSDGWSIEILKRELSALYRAFSSGKESPLRPLSIQYADYAIWQRQWLQGEILERQLKYWRTQLAGVPDLLALPTDRPRGAVQNLRAASTSFTISPALTAELKKLGQHAGATLFIVVLAAFQTFLSRFCNQEDIVVGTPIANRTHTEIEGLIGFFVNTLVLRTDLSGHPSFLEVVQRVRQVVLDALTYQDLPFEQIVEAIQPERNLSRSPLFQVMFVLQNVPQEEIDFFPLVVSTLESEQTAAKFDLTLALAQREQGLEGEFEYNTDLFEPETISRMIEHFQILLAALVATPTQPVKMLSLLSQERYQQIVINWNATERDYSREQLVFELLEEQAALRPEAPALSARGVEMTYGDLNRRANQLARHLQRLGVGPGCSVGIYMQRNLEMIVALCATLKVGAAYLPLDASTPQARAAFILQETQVALLITQESLMDRLPAHELPLLCLERERAYLETLPSENLERKITADYPAYVIFTSGSTGTPKGVLVDHKALLNMVCWYQEAFAINELDKTTHLANLGFDAAVFEIWPYLTKGAEIFLVEEEMRLSPTALVPWLVQREITVCFIPTSLVELVIKRPWPAQTRLRLLLTGGDQLHGTPIEHMPFTLINMYGPTENTVVTTWSPIPAGQEESRLPVIGRPIANTQVHVLNETGAPQPIGIAGELCISGQSLSQGYLHRPDLTAACFVPDPFSSQAGARMYKTGDMVRYLPDGNLEFLGRRDHQVKIRGFRIELGEIESVLMSQPDVREAIVVVSESVPGEKRLVAYVVPQEGASLTREELQRALKDRLPDYMVPTAFAILEDLPLTSHGKVDRQALALRRPLNLATQEKYIAPRDAIELQLLHLWERLLGVSPISVTDNFFQLGGHSLAGVRLMSQIQRLFGLELPLSTLFEGGTIGSLAAVLRQQAEQAVFTPLVEIQTHGNNPPFFCVHPSGGDVLCYMKLAQHLGSDQPVYGLRAVAPQDNQEGSPSLEEMAASYREALYAVQPQGPYLLAGWSMGGVIAFEMARQLEEQGQSVAFLGLFDSYLPPDHFDDDEQTLLTTFISDLAGMSDSTFSYPVTQGAVSDTEEQLKQLLLAAQRANILPPGVDAAYLKRLFSTFKNNVEALCNYRPQPYAGQITLFRSSAFTTGDQVEMTYGWYRFAAQVNNHALPGDHYTILRDPQVEGLAKQVLSCIKEAMVESPSGETLSQDS